MKDTPYSISRSRPSLKVVLTTGHLYSNYKSNIQFTVLSKDTARTVTMGLPAHSINSYTSDRDVLSVST